MVKETMQIAMSSMGTNFITPWILGKIPKEDKASSNSRGKEEKNSWPASRLDKTGKA